jgi:hypothetical protein
MLLMVSFTTHIVELINMRLAASSSSSQQQQPANTMLLTPTLSRLALLLDSSSQQQNAANQHSNATESCSYEPQLVADFTHAHTRTHTCLAL